ncbi:hypothetical protein [Tsukamurella pulmonis]|uniref:hypothetical protein n=1 Tax=Tsukamurella pulmonis TaxID=47312 RepID=UPI000E08FBBE|nr:hypothetical protein [Tsukamurella pulmonis]RDH12016.1 hypothetical protein DVB88_09700 [Tsukamurella pulmonis]
MTTITEQIEAKKAELAALEEAQQQERDAAALAVGRALVAHLDDEEAFVAAARDHAQQHRVAQEKAEKRRAAARERAAKAKERKAAETAANLFAQ